MVFGLPRGIPAIILLLLVNITVAVVNIKTSDHHTGVLNGDGIWWFFVKSPTKVRSTATAFVALPFWIWAIHNQRQGETDLGTITFPLVILASLLNRCFAENANHEGKTAVFLLACNIILTINYCLPLFAVKLSWGLNLYAGIGALYWTLVTFWNWRSYLNELGRIKAALNEESSLKSSRSGSAGRRYL